MKTRLPIQAKSTERIMRAILPSEFKMVSDKNSNGYKFINLLYGAEIDEGISNLKEVYNNSFFSTFDLTKNFELYEVTISGVPNGNYLNASNTNPIKITDENEFNNGSPTRIKDSGSIQIPMYYISYSGSAIPSIAGLQNSFVSGCNIECWSEMSGFIGLEYFRKTKDGSGYLMISSDINQSNGFISGLYPLFIVNIGNNFQDSGNYKEIYGLFTGIKKQDYSNNSKNEILYPIDGKTLSGMYPLSRYIIDDSGISHYIDHYTPDHGWIRNENNEVVAVVDYSGTYYFDGDGKKIYYRTAYNNPYGYNNYTTAYLDLEHIPISGTLKLYDIDILDYSGNATEIPQTGKILYYYKSTKMLQEPEPIDAAFDPIYVGYNQIVPSGIGLSSNMEGYSANPLKTISWDYLHDGGKIDEGTLLYIDGTGLITNRIKINNYYTRYMVEYNYKIYDEIKYISSIDSNGSISLHTSNPIYTTTRYDGNLKEIDYEFTKDPSYILKNGNVIKNQSSKIVTFDGLDIRPYKFLYKTDFNIPIIYKNGSLYRNLQINTNKKSIGYSSDFIVEDKILRTYVVNCLFDQDVIANTVTEIDLTGNSNALQFANTGTNLLYKINYNTYYGKRIIRGTGNSYFYKLNKSFLLDNTFFEFKFKLRKSANFTLLDIQDLNLGQYFIVNIDETGLISINCNNYTFYCREKLKFNAKEKSITIKYSVDELSESIPKIMVYLMEEGDFGFRIIDCFKSQSIPMTVLYTYLHVYKNVDIDIKEFKIFYKVQ